MTLLSMIWAQGRNRAIGSNNTLPWSVPEDLAHFKAKTIGHPVIMGRKTFESLGRPLPGRKNIVLTSVPDWLPQSVTGVDGLQRALSTVCSGQERVTVIGGGLVYAQAIDLADELWVTDVDVEVENPDAWAPEISTDDWVLVEQGEWMTSIKGLRYRFSHWKKRERS